MKQPQRPSRTYGFAQAASLVTARIRTASESRGFAVTRLLTHWPEVVGESVARIARPVSVGHGRGGLGATLTLLTTGPHAPMLEMQKDQIRDRVNACYGYRAIARIRITQTAPTGFAEGQTPFEGPPRRREDPAPEVIEAAQEAASKIENTELRLALAALATNVLHKKRN